MSEVVFCCTKHPDSIIYHRRRDCPLCLMKKELDKLLTEGELQVELKFATGKGKESMQEMRAVL